MPLKSKTTTDEPNKTGVSKESTGSLEEISDSHEAILFTNAALNAHSDTIFLFDWEKGKALRWNQAFRDISGYTDEEIENLPVPSSYYDPQDLERIGAIMEEVLREGHATIELELICKDGTRVPTEYQVSAFDAAVSNTRYAIAIGRDISGRVRAEVNLRESEAKLRDAQSMARLGNWWWDVDTGKVEWSEEVYNIFGLEQDKFTPQIDSILALSPWSEENRRDKELIDKAIKNKEQGHYEQRFLRPDHSIGYYYSTFQGVYDQDGKLTAIKGIVQDITARKHAEEKLMRQQKAITLNNRIAEKLLTCPRESVDTELLAVVLDALACDAGMIGRVDDDGFFLCKAATGKLGDMVSSDTGTVPGDPKTLNEPWKAAFAGGEALAVDGPVPLPWGEGCLKNTMSSPLVHQGRTIGLICAADKAGGFHEHDRHLLSSAAGQIAPVLGARMLEDKERRERQSIEEQFRQAQKMEAIGKLAGGISHDFNNLLTVINSYAQLANGELEDGHPLKNHLFQIEKAGKRAADLTRQLLAFSRRQVMEPRVLNLNLVVANMEQMLQRLIGEDITLRTALHGKLGSVRFDPRQIEQVLMNLVVNARDAMPGGGNLTIETSNVELDDQYASTHQDAIPGSYVMLAVADDGEGMDQGTLSRVFEPFFTTKQVGQGTGLGLATVYGIVRQGGGSILVYSEVQEGTTFKVYLPRVDSPAEERMEKKAAQPQRGTESIVVVEDDPSVRSLVADILSSTGYQVHEAAGPEEALELIGSSEVEIDLLLTDVIMPRMSGKKLADRILAVRPSVKVLYMSGYTDNTIVHHGVLDAGVQLVSKPFTAVELLQRLRDVLDS